MRAVPAGEHEPVAPGPGRVGGVVPHHLLEQQVGRRRQAHGGAGVAVADLLHGVHGEDPRRCPPPSGRARSSRVQREWSRVSSRRRRSATGPGGLGAAVAHGSQAPPSLLTRGDRLAHRSCPPDHRRRSPSSRVARNPVTHVRQSASALSTARRRPATFRDVVAAYVGLTKPRVIELLLLTTVPVMFFAAAGRPAAGPRRRHRRRRHALGRLRVDALNCVYDRDIDEQMRRTRRRALPRHIVSPRAALVFGLVLGVVSTRAARRLGQLALGRRCRSLANAFYVLGYTMVLKRRTTQNIVWGGARRLLPGADRLDGGHRRAGVGAGRAVPGGLLLDAAAHLGARAALPRGLRERRRADAARRRAGRRGRPPDRALQLGDGGDLAAAVAGRRHRAVLPGRRGGAGRRLPGRGAPDVAAHRGHREPQRDPADAAVPLLEPLPLAAVRRGRLDPLLSR